MKKARVDIALEYPSSKEAGVVCGAFSPEMGQGPEERSTWTVSQEGKTVRLEAEASDAPALRATVNTAWRWLKLTDEIIKE